MSAADPLVSVLMPSFNGARLIGETLASVLAQTMPDLEVVVVDDGSSDGTVEVVRGIGDPRIRLFQTEHNAGPAVARTIALGHARGRFIAGLDQDDLCEPGRLAAQLAFLDAHPDHVLVTSTIAPFGDGTMVAEPYPDLVDPGRIDWELLIASPLAWSTVLIRGEAARALDPFQRDAVRFAEDYDTYCRLRPAGKIGRLAAPLVRYRTHAASTSRTHEERMIHSAAVVMAELYGDLFGGEELAAGLLLNRHAAAGRPPPDAATLRACGRVLARLLDARGDLAPGYAAASASRHWWRIARAGLSAGSYGLASLAAARPAFAQGVDADLRRLARAGLIGAARRLSGRRAF